MVEDVKYPGRQVTVRFDGADDAEKRHVLPSDQFVTRTDGSGVVFTFSLAVHVPPQCARCVLLGTPAHGCRVLIEACCAYSPGLLHTSQATSSGLAWPYAGCIAHLQPSNHVVGGLHSSLPTIHATAVDGSKVSLEWGGRSGPELPWGPVNPAQL